MPTTDERREVAKGIRSDDVFWHVVKKDIDTYRYYLAELIEPEPERTCRNLACDDDVFICSECDNETHGFMVDKFGCTVGLGKVVCKCPNCGAKVIE